MKIHVQTSLHYTCNANANVNTNYNVHARSTLFMSLYTRTLGCIALLF